MKKPRAKLSTKIDEICIDKAEQSNENQGNSPQESGEFSNEEQNNHYDDSGNLKFFDKSEESWRKSLQIKTSTKLIEEENKIISSPFFGKKKKAQKKRVSNKKSENIEDSLTSIQRERRSGMCISFNIAGDFNKNYEE